MTRFVPALICLALVSLVSGCGNRGPRPSVAVPDPDPCFLGLSEPGRPGLIEFAVLDSIDLAAAPVPGNDSERILFRQVYEGLVAADCRGSLIPALASDWRPLYGGRVWEFEIRPDARFSDGTRVTAESIRQSWSRNRFRFSNSDGRPPWSWVRPESVRAMGNNVLRVHLSRSLGPEPGLFAHPALAVAKPGEPVPLGSGPFRIEEGPGAGIIMCRPNPHQPRPGVSSIRFTTNPGADSRDLIGPGSDAAVVRERDAVAYALEIDDLRVSPLGWNRIYLLASPYFPGSTAGRECERTMRELRVELAANVLESEAMAVSRFALGGEAVSGCEKRMVEVLPPPAPAAGPRIVYEIGDGDAAAIAARLVALTGQEDSTAVPGALCLVPDASPVAAGETPPVVLGSAVSASDFAYVLGIRREYPDPCMDLTAVREIVPWLRLSSDEEPMIGRDSRLRFSAVPLVMARSNLVFRRTLTGVGVSWDGVPLFREAGWLGEKELP